MEVFSKKDIRTFMTWKTAYIQMLKKLKRCCVAAES